MRPDYLSTWCRLFGEHRIIDGEMTVEGKHVKVRYCARCGHVEEVTV